MPGDAFSLWVLVIRTGLNVSALIAIGLALHAALGVVERADRRSFNPLAFGAVFAVLLFTGARLVVLNLQMGDGSRLFDPDIFALSWSTLGFSTLSLSLGALAIAAGCLTCISWLAGTGAVLPEPAPKPHQGPDVLEGLAVGHVHFRVPGGLRGGESVH